MQKEGNARPPIYLLEIEAGSSPTATEVWLRDFTNPLRLFFTLDCNTDGSPKYEVKMLRLAW
jgi:hypothetical protein